ncbi:hypothetical protein Tco_1521597 [Tanacetum coccineum]
MFHVLPLKGMLQRAHRLHLTLKEVVRLPPDSRHHLAGSCRRSSVRATGRLQGERQDAISLEREASRACCRGDPVTFMNVEEWGIFLVTVPMFKFSGVYYTEELKKTRDQCNRYKGERNCLRSVRQKKAETDSLSSASITEHSASRRTEKFLPAFIDFRGRIYRSGILHFHERDLARSLPIRNSQL